MNKKNENIERQLAFAVFLTALPLTTIILLFLIFSSASWLLIVTIIFIVLVSVASGAAFVHFKAKNYLLTIANLVEGVRHGDYSFRLNLVNKSGAQLDVSKEINLLVESKQKQRVSRIESNIVLEKLIEQIEIPLLVIDSSEAIRNANQSAATLFNLEQFELIGLSSEQLKIREFLSLDSEVIINHRFPSRSGRWDIKSKIIRSEGKKYRLLVISDVSRALRHEERNAWSRIVRVIGHELNNSLTSISSLAEALLIQLSRHSQSVDLKNIQKGLQLIVDRGDSLQRFMTAYAELAKLPAPVKEWLSLNHLLSITTELYGDKVRSELEEDLELFADKDQLQAALINLIKNAIEANPADACVIVRVIRKYQGVAIQVIDEGAGVSNRDNLFVPFYTTKEKGSGIGLVISREIAEGHNGTLSLSNREDRQGCVAELWLPTKS